MCIRDRTREQQRQDRYRGVALGDRVGQSGVEYQYDRFLRGRNGANRVEVDAMGNLRRTLEERRPAQGRQLRLSVDLDVQRAGPVSYTHLRAHETDSYLVCSLLHEKK